MRHLLRVCAVAAWASFCLADAASVPLLATRPGGPGLAWAAMGVLAVTAIGGIVVIARDRRRNPWTALADERRKFALKQASHASGIHLKHLQYVEEEESRGGRVIDRRTGQPVAAMRGASR